MLGIDRKLAGRLTRLLLVVGLVAAPAFALRLLCIGRSCDRADQPVAEGVPFCPLPAEIRQLVTDGYRVGRSADVFAISNTPSVEGSDPTMATGAAATWPWLDVETGTRVPVVFIGPGLPAKLPVDVGLDDVGPTLAHQIGLDWAYPQYRDGASLTRPGPIGEPARLALIIAWKGVGSDELGSPGAPADHPFLTSLMVRKSYTPEAHTLGARTGALPIDSTAALTSMGTGGLPATHGIVGTRIRNEGGALVEAWSGDAPVSVITTFGDALDETSRGAAKIALVSGEPFDRGLIGGTWYPGPRDDDDVRIVDEARIAPTAEKLLAAGYGADDATPDILAIGLEGDIRAMDRTTQRIVAAAERATDGSVAIAIAGTGSASAGETQGAKGLSAAQVTAAIDGAARSDVVEAAVPGAVFLDQAAVTKQGISPGTAVNALTDLRLNGRPVVAGAFPGYAVSFARYC